MVLRRRQVFIGLACFGALGDGSRYRKLTLLSKTFFTLLGGAITILLKFGWVLAKRCHSLMTYVILSYEVGMMCTPGIVGRLHIPDPRGERAGIRLGTTGSTSLVPVTRSVRTLSSNLRRKCGKQASVRLFCRRDPARKMGVWQTRRRRAERGILEKKCG